MPDQTSVLAMPLILPSQAQKHVTHNEALRILDVAVQLTVLSRSLTDPPTNPAIGDRYIVKQPAGGDWTGHARKIALFGPEGWEIHPAMTGWRCFVQDEGVLAVFDGAQWIVPGGDNLTTGMLGVNTAADTVNRLAVRSDATLFTHDSGSHQLKVNKGGFFGTGSLLFQNQFNARAELGLIGDDDFTIKLSQDGGTFTEVMRADLGTSRVLFPSGLRATAGELAAPPYSFIGDGDTGLASPVADSVALVTGGGERLRATNTGVQVTGTLTGTAVTQSAVDATADRLLKVGDFGLGNTGTRLLPNNSAADGAPSGLYNTDANTLNLGELAATNGAMLVLARGSGSSNPGGTQIWRRSAAQLVWRSFANGTPGPWREFIHTGNILGTVAQSGGLPTGALFERGANANGEYVRFADGTQICTRLVTITGNYSTITNVACPATFLPGTMRASIGLGNQGQVNLTAAERREIGAHLYVEANTEFGTIWRHAVSHSVAIPAGAEFQIVLTAIGRWF